MKKRKVSEDIVVPRSKIPEMVARTGALGEKHGLLTCSFGHAGDGNLHAQILFDDESELPRVEALLDDLFAATLDYLARSGVRVQALPATVSKYVRAIPASDAWNDDSIGIYWPEGEALQEGSEMAAALSCCLDFTGDGDGTAGLGRTTMLALAGKQHERSPHRRLRGELSGSGRV